MKPCLILTIACVYVPNDPGRQNMFRQFCLSSLPYLSAQSDILVTSGFIVPSPISDELKTLAATHSDNVVWFEDNAGKSAYINKVMANYALDEGTHVCTVDCDIFFPNPNYGMLAAMSEILEAPELSAGIVAPSHTGDIRHTATVFANKLVYYSDTLATDLWWSDEVPNSVAGGIWMFPKYVYDKKQNPPGFDDVGSYGPEDVLFARFVHGILGLRCYLATGISAHHCLFP